MSKINCYPGPLLGCTYWKGSVDIYVSRKRMKTFLVHLGATSIDKIGEVWLSGEIGEGWGFEILRKITL